MSARALQSIQAPCLGRRRAGRKEGRPPKSGLFRSWPPSTLPSEWACRLPKPGHWKLSGATVAEGEALLGVSSLGIRPLSRFDLPWGAGLDMRGPRQVSQWSAVSSAFFLWSGSTTQRQQERSVGKGHRSLRSPHGLFIMPTGTSLERFSSGLSVAQWRPGVSDMGADSCLIPPPLHHKIIFSNTH